ncbi:MAG TPA: metallophosphoesterase [Pyrinomonadaceae bacterium]|jgi:5'-nucleotidase|nr:metallophosphoesterase [Pyrinomonadaceae bacterium]
MINRRRFLQTSLFGGAALAFPRRLSNLISPWSPIATPLLDVAADESLITILHTNDTHSQIDPIEATDKQYGGKGGVARRATLVKRIRKENPNTLMIDAGDVFQGTPYFNFFKGEVEYKSMSMIGYDVGTLGNHDFDNGVAGLAAAMKFANFDFVSTNYDVRGTPLESRVKPYVVRTLAGVRIGLFGLGISPDNLITPDNFKGVKYLDPVQTTRGVVRLLREQEKCQLVVGMSHLGYYTNTKNNEIGDTQVAAQVSGIDFIASGHTHTFMEKPVLQKNPEGKDTIVFQVGKSGIYVGRIDFKLKGGKVIASAGRLLDLRDETLA